jgi:5-hydroxyisourate hydrolase-like protein (transthyretin family)
MWLTATLLFGISVAALAAEPSTLLRGSVLDAKGKPLAGVPVGIYLNKEVEALRKAQPKLALATRTDAAGKFQLSLPRSLGQVLVVARRSGLAIAQASAKLDTQRELPPLRLSAGMTLNGRATDEAGRALAAVKVSADLWSALDDSTVGPLQRFSALSRADGSFAVTGLEAGSYRIRAELAGYGIWDKENVYLEKDAAKNRALKIALRPAAYLAGVVTDQGGQPLAGAKLAELGQSPKIVTVTDGAGRFRLGPFAVDGDAQLTVSHTGYTTRYQTFKAPQSDLQVVLSQGGVLRGRVVDAATGAPVTEFGIAFEERMDDPSIVPDRRGPSAVTARDGRFEVKGVPAGPATIVALARGYMPGEVQGIDIIPGEPTPEVLIELKRGITLRGRVIDKASGKPLAGVQISQGDSITARLREDRGLGHAPATSDADGLFALEGLPAGTLSITAESKNHADLSRRMVLTQDTSVELALSLGATITGQVLAADGVTPVQASVQLQWETERENWSSGGASDAQGRFELKHRAAGRYKLSALTQSQVTPAKEITVAGDERLDGIKLVFEAAPMIRGTIAGLSPEELTRLRMAGGRAPQAPDGKWYWSGELFQESSDIELDGTAYRLQQRGLRAGPTIVIAGPAQGPQIQKRVTMPERGAGTVDFDFAGGMQVAGRVTRAGKPAAGIAMVALPDEGQPVAGVTQTTASGEYRFADLARGTYRIGPANVKPLRLQMTGNVVQDFELPALEVAGRASDAMTGRPLSAVRVELRTTQVDAVTESRSVLTDHEGAFKLDQLAPGEYVLTLQRTGYDVARQELALRSSLDNLSLPLRAAEGVRMRVRGPELGKIPGVTLIERVGTSVVAEIYVPLDGSGSGKIPPSLEGRTFSIDAWGYEPFPVNNWDGDPLDVPLRGSRRR